MTQSRLGSFIEANANAAIGYGVSVAVVYALRAAGWWDASPWLLPLVFWIASVARGYVIRRAVEWWRKR